VRSILLSTTALSYDAAHGHAPTPAQHLTQHLAQHIAVFSQEEVEEATFSSKLERMWTDTGTNENEGGICMKLLVPLVTFEANNARPRPHHAMHQLVCRFHRLDSRRSAVHGRGEIHALEHLLRLRELLQDEHLRHGSADQV
jgi:hypothetical protein